MNIDQLKNNADRDKGYRWHGLFAILGVVLALYGMLTLDGRFAFGFILTLGAVIAAGIKEQKERKVIEAEEIE